jgi:hypothetical protein
MMPKPNHLHLTRNLTWTPTDEEGNALPDAPVYDLILEESLRKSCTLCAFSHLPKCSSDIPCLDGSLGANYYLVRQGSSN